MFEKIIADVLTLYLGNYIKDLNKQNLKVAIWNGEVSLENLKLKKKALNSLGIPVTVKAGLIGKLQLKVPWHNIKNEPLLIEIDRVFLIAEPKDKVNWDESEVKRREQQQKQEKLKWIEIMNASSAPIQRESQQTGPLEAFITKVVDNLQFSIRNVHIRYEDDSNPQNPFSVGLILEHLSAQSTNEEWNPVFLMSEHKLIYKLVSLKNLSIYWNSSEERLKFESLNEMSQLLNNMIYNQSNHHHILNPICGSLKMVLNKNYVSDKQLPKYTFTFEFEDIAISSEQTQFRQLFDLLDTFSLYSKGVKYQKLRPTIRPKENPKIWWNFARDCILSDIRERRYLYSPQYVAQRKQKKLEYITLYKNKRKQELLGSAKERLNQLELELNIESILLFQSIAEKQLKSEQSSSAKNKEKEQTYAQGWLNWLFKSKSGTDITDEINDGQNFEFTQEDKEKFYSAIEYDATQNSNSSSQDGVKMVFNFSIKKGSTTLKSGLKHLDILSAVFKSFSLSFTTQNESFQLKASLESMKLLDRYIPNTSFPYIIRPLKTKKETDSPFFSMCLDYKPPDSSQHKYRLNLQMLPLEVIYNKPCFDQIAAFFKIKGHSTILSELESAAIEHLEALKNRTANTIVKELTDRTLFDIAINISAPKVLIPENLLQKDTLVLMIDLGEISVQSFTPELKKTKGELSSAEFNYYDGCLVQLTSLQLVMGLNHELSSSTESLQLVQKFSIHASLYYCLQKSVKFSRFKVFTNLPSLRFFVSLQKSVKLLKIIKKTLHDLQPQIPVYEDSTFTPPKLSRRQSESKVVELVVESKFLETYFSIPEILVFLNKQNDQPLISICISGIGARFIKRTYDTSFFFCMQNFTVEDYKYPLNSEFRRLISSNTLGEYMLQASFVSVEESSPQYYDINQEIDLYFNNLSFICNRETVAELIELTNLLHKTWTDTISQKSFSIREKKSEFEPVYQSDEKPFKISASLESLNIMFNRDDAKFCTIQMTNSSILVEKRAQSKVSKGSLGGLFIEDWSQDQGKSIEIFGISGEQMIDFFYENYLQGQADFDAIIRIRMTSIFLTYIHRFMKEFRDYITEINAMRVFFASTASRAAEVAKDAVEVATKKLVKMELEIENPHIFIPKSSTSRSTLIVDLGHISIYNKFFESEKLGTLEEVTIRVSNTNLRAYLSKTEDRKIVEDISYFIFKLERPAANNTKIKPNRKIIGEISKIDIKLNEIQYGLLLGILKNNFRETTRTSINLQQQEQEASIIQTEPEQNQVEVTSTQILFNLGHISLELIRASPGNQQSLVFFELNRLSMAIVQLSNETIKGNLFLHSVFLNDTRPNSSNKFKRMFGPSCGDEKDNLPFLKIHFKRNNLNDVDFEIFAYFERPRFVFIPEAIFAIQSFLSTGLKKLFNQKKEDQPNKDSTSSSSTLQETPTSVQFICCISKAEIYFPEDSDTKNSKALVGNSNFLVKYESNAKETKTSLVGENLEIWKSFMNHNAENAISILEPLEFSAYTSYSQNQSAKTKILMEMIRMTVSYRDIMLIKNIWKSFYQSSTTESLTHRTIRTQKKEKTSTNIADTIEFRSGGAKITLIDDCQQRNIPLADIKIMEASVEASSDELKIHTVAGIDYYNPQKAAWEPVMEQWAFQVNTKFAEVNRFEIRASQRLNMNFTKPFFDTIWNTLQGWKEDYYTLSSEYPSRFVRHPFILRNETGQSLRYWLSTMENNDSMTLEDKQEIPLVVPSVKTKNRSIVETQTTLCIHLIPWNPIFSLPINRVGVYLIPLTPKPKDNSIKLIYEISFREGSKVLTFRSNVLIKNETKFLLEVCFEVEKHQPVLLDSAIKPGESRAIPLELASIALLRFRPSRNYSWSQKEEFQDKQHQLIRCVSLQSTNSFYYIVKISGDKANRSEHYVISILPPMIIENLLPCNMEFKMFDKMFGRIQIQENIETGKEIHLHEIDTTALMNIKVPDFEWSQSICISASTNIQNIRVLDEHNRPLTLHAQMNYSEDGILKISIFCRYWMINRTGLKILYRSSIEHFQNASEKIAAGQSPFQYSHYSMLQKEPREWYDPKQSKEFAKPFMFSYNSFKLFESKTSIKIANSTWSKGISLESAGMVGFLEIPDQTRPGKDLTKLFEVGVSIDLGESQFYRTKVVTFSPRFILFNNIGSEMYIKQKDTEKAHIYSLHPKERIPWHWPSKDHPKELCISIQGSEWSSGFSLTQLGELAVKIPLRSQSLSNYYLARMQIKLESSTFFVIFNSEDKAFPPFRIENLTSVPITVYQKAIGIPQVVSPYQATPFTWDDPSQPNRLIVEIENSNFASEFNLHIIKIYDPVEVVFETEGQESVHKEPLKLTIRCEVFADGPTRVIRIFDTSIFISKEITSYANKKMDTKKIILKQMFFDIAGIGISVIDTTPQELMYLSLESISFEYENSNIAQGFQCMIGKLQIDNQLSSSHFPVFLAPHPTNKKKMFHLSAVKSNQYESIDFFLYFSVLLQELDLNIDENFLNQLINFINPLLETYYQKNVKPTDEAILTPSSFNDKKIYFESLNFNPIKINLSYATHPGNGRQETFLRTIVSAIGVTLANLDGAQISLNALILDHPFATREELINRISKYYYWQALRELYKVIGSFEFLGAPVSLVQNLGTGVHDFFYEPAHALVRSPEDLLNGLARGTTSLVQNTLYGIFNTLSKISGSLGKGLAHLAMDESYLREREINGREKPHYLGQGIALGIQEFSQGVYKGLTGIFNEPIMSVQQRGIGGLAKGLSRAMLGATIKPFVGLIDIATRTTQAISYTASMEDNKVTRRLRPPRYFGPDLILQPYSIEKAFGQTVLFHVDAGKHRDEWYLFHQIQDNFILLVSDRNVFFLEMIPAGHFTKSTLKKRGILPLKSITRIEKTKDALLFHSKNISPNKYTIPVQNPKLLEKIYYELEQIIQNEKMIIE